MEIKFKLFTTIAQALDKLKKQFDKNDKSLVKTQTTLDETIVNIDNVIDSVARTMTEALDPYFVDMIYGYIDDNGKFKLGVIKDPYTDASPTDQSNIIPTNATKIYHYGDKDFIENITTLKLFMNTPNLIFDNLDFSKLFPKLTNIYSMRCDYIKELTLYSNIGYGSMNILRIDTLIINGFTNSSIPKFYNTKINNLKLIDTTRFSYNNSPEVYFAFESSNDIEGWDNLTELNYRKSDNSADYLIEFVIHSNLKNVYLQGRTYVILEGTDKTISLGSSIKLKIDSLDNYLTHTFNKMSLANQCEIIIDNVIFDGILDLSGRSNIPSYAFYSFPITKLIISDAITSIGINAFDRSYLSELHISSLYTFLNSIKSRIFHVGSWIRTNTDLYVSNVLTRDIIIPDGITSISSRLFERFNIDSIDCGNVTNIGDRAFANSTLSSINLRNVESLGMYIFEGLNLKKLIIPESITSLNKYVLDKLTVDVLVFERNLNYIEMQRDLNISKTYIKYDGVVYINSLSYISVDIIYVPIVHVDSYKSNNNWSVLADKIFPYDFELNPDNI